MLYAFELGKIEAARGAFIKEQEIGIHWGQHIFYALLIHQ
jgi:hypothetical protein